MTEQKNGNTKALLQASYLVITRTTLFTILGIIINWIYIFIAVWPIAGKYGTPFACTSGMLNWVVINMHIVFYVLIFFIVMPFLFFIFGKGFAIKMALAAVFDHIKPELYDYITRAAILIKEKAVNKKIISKTAESLTGRYSGLPGGIQKLFRFILNRLPMKDLIEKAAEITNISENNFEQSLDAVSKIADQYIRDKFFTTSYNMLLVLIAIDAAAVIATVLFV